MYRVIISKRFEYAIAHQHEELPIHGHNHEAFFSFTGPVQENDGMIMELSKIKTRVLNKILNTVDHVFIKDSLPELANKLLATCQREFEEDPIIPISVHIHEKPFFDKVTASINNPTYYHRSVFLYGISTFGWAKNQFYPIRATATLEIIAPAFSQGLDKWAHLKNNALYNQDISAQSLSYCIQMFWKELSQLSPTKLTLTVNNLGISYDGYKEILVYRQSILAAHYLKKEGRTPEENKALFGRCTQLHGHNFDIEMQMLPKNDFQETYGELLIASDAVLRNWQYSVLPDGIASLAGKTATCETFITSLAHDLAIHIPLVSLQLSETENNRFEVNVDV